jgi:hypothetical protein
MVTPTFPENMPPEGETVTITLDNGVSISATWDGVQWWAGLNDEPEDVPISNDYVASWEPAS